MIDYTQVVITMENKEDAERIARTLVEGRLAACVQIRGPIESTYHWKGRIETNREWQCVAKTRCSLFTEIARTVQGLHPYEVPEILATPISAANPSYLVWLDAEVKKAE